MNARILAGVAAFALLAGCGADAPASDAQGEPNGLVGGQAPPDDRTATAGPAAEKAAPPAVVEPASVEAAEFAYRCRGLLSAAWASASVLPAGEVPPGLDRIDMGAVSWWSGEAARRGQQAGATEEQRAEWMRATTRVIRSREQLEEAMPMIRECLDRRPV